MKSTVSPRVTVVVAAAPAVHPEGRALAQRAAGALTETSQVVLLSTCHRVELYGSEPSDLDGPLEGMRAIAGASAFIGDDAARHLIDLAVGLRSAVLAEDQLIHQLRSAVGEARRRGPLGRDLDTLLDVALRAGRTARSWRPSASGQALSLADVAMARVRDLIGPLAGRRLLVVGTGPMGRAVSTAATQARARVHVASPTTANAVAEATRVGGTAWPIDPGPRLADLDAVVIALAGPWRIGPSSVAAVAACPVVVDLSMPSAIGHDLRERLAGRLVDVDAFAGTLPIEPADTATTRYRRRLERLAADTLAAYIDDVAARSRSVADQLAKRVERQRSDELDAYLRRRPDVSPEVRRHLDSLTRDLSRRMFREPLRRLADDPDGRRRRAYDELFGS